MTKGHKSGRGEIKPSLVGHKAPAGRSGQESPDAAAGGSRPEVGREVDCELPGSDIARNSPGAAGGRDERPPSRPDRSAKPAASGDTDGESPAYEQRKEAS